MNKLLLIFMFCTVAITAFAQQTQPKEDNSFKIVGIVTLLGSLLLAVRALKSTYKK